MTQPPRHPHESHDSDYAMPLAALSVSAAAAFLLMARAVARRETAALDRKVQRKTKASRGTPARKAASAASPVGKWWSYVPAAAVTGLYVIFAGDSRRKAIDNVSRLNGAAAIVGAAGLAAVINQFLDDLIPQPPAPPGRPKDHPVFPSGHAFGTTAVALAAAHVLTREELVEPALIYPLAAVLPLVTAAARMMEEKHWLSDIIGGYLAALAVAGVPLTMYEAAKRRRFRSG
jgi:undecaprenyl-diphosphatase